MNCSKCAAPIPDDAQFCLGCGASASGDAQEDAQETLSVAHERDLFRQLQEELGDEFVLERELGRGGMAIVYLGHDSRLNRKVAVKLLPPELTYSRGSSMVERFKREAQTAARLDHPNVIPVYRVSHGGRLLWYVMKYLDGEPLDDIIRREGQLSVERTVDIVGQAAAALDYAHQNQVVHRDVKPGNVLVDKRGWVTVTDFGIAKVLDLHALTATDSIIGTPDYISPEQCRGRRVGPAADQYSLAVMTYEMLSGKLPFDGDSAVEIVYRHVVDPVPSLALLRPSLPRKIVAVVERGLAKAAEERFASVAEFAAALKAAAAEAGLHRSVAPTATEKPSWLSKTVLINPVPFFRSQRKGLIFATVAGLVIVAGVVGTLVLQPWRPRPSVPSATAPEQGAPLPGQPSVSSPPAQPQVTPPRRTSPEGTPRAASSPGRQATRSGRAFAPPMVQQQAARPAAPPIPSAAQPTPQPTGQPPATGRLFVTAVPTPTMIEVDGQRIGPAIINREMPAGTHQLRFEGVDALGPWYAERLVQIRAGETTRLSRVELQPRRP